MEVGTFVCSICGDPSQMICVYCTKDACGNHLCDRCHRCSDCCACELTFREDKVAAPAASRNGHVAMEAHGQNGVENGRGEDSGILEG
jgi:hypothetical protein